MNGVTKYFACKSLRDRRELQASCFAEAYAMLEPGEILQSERALPLEDQIRYHACEALRYQYFHRSAIALIRKRRLVANNRNTCLLNDARVYRNMFAYHRKALERAMHRAAVAACDSATCTECQQGAA